MEWCPTLGLVQLLGVLDPWKPGDPWCLVPLVFGVPGPFGLECPHIPALSMLGPGARSPGPLPARCSLVLSACCVWAPGAFCHRAPVHTCIVSAWSGCPRSWTLKCPVRSSAPVVSGCPGHLVPLVPAHTYAISSWSKCPEVSAGYLSLASWWV